MNKLIFLITSILCIVLQAKVSMSNPNQICFKPESGDSAFFATSVAVNGNYLAVGDPGANRVIIYTPDDSGQWIRTKEILPPKDSIPYFVGSGFGRDLQLDGNVLAIGAITQQRTSEVTNPEDFQAITTHYTPYVLTFEGRYLTRLDSEIEVKAISLPIEKQSGFVQFNLLTEGKIKQVLLADNGEEEFGFATAVYNNLFIVGSPSYSIEGGAWLFDLTTSSNKPKKLFYPNTYMGESVAVSNRFAVVGDRGQTWLYPSNYVSNIPSKTLVKAIDNGSTSVIDSYGKLSLSDNILAVMFPPSPDGEQASLLEIFRLDDNAVPHLILKRDYLEDAWVQNGFLLTVSRDEELLVPKLCIETLSQINNKH